VKKIKKPFLIKYSTFPELNGTLIPFYTNKSFPKKFVIKRFFILYGKKKYLRADHAHSKCSQIIIPLSGEITVKIISKKYKRIFKLNTKNKKAIYVPPYNWMTIYFKNNNNSLLTLCNYKYDKKEYISYFSKFKKIILK
jgi:dTDP-4-dehydrorhamnose 3,5-epimerase-like enzyme